MHPDESVKQKLERYQRTWELTNQIRFNQASRPYSKTAEESITQRTSSRLIQAQAAIDRNDMEFVRSYIRTLSELDPANPYYTNLLKRDFIPWDEFQEIVSNFSANHSYLVRMQDEINNLSLAAEREGEIQEEPPVVDAGTEQTDTSQPEEDQMPGQEPGGQEESPGNQPARQAPRREPQRVQPREKKSAVEKSIDRHARKMEKRKPENIEERKKARKARRQQRRAQKKFNNSRLGRGLNRANNILNAPNRLSIRLGERFSNSRLGKNLARINSLLGAPGRFLNKFLSNLGNRFVTRFLNNRFGRVLGRVGRGLNALDRFLNPIDYYMDKLMGKLASRLGRLAMQGAKFAARLAMQAARFLANLAARALSQLASQAAGGAARAAAMTVGRGALLLLANPITWIVIGVVGLFLFFWWYDNLVGNAECNKPEGVMKLIKQADNIVRPKLEYENGEKIDYIIQVTYELACRTRSLPSLIVTDKIPDGTEPVEGSAKSGFYNTAGTGPDGVYDASTRTVTWTFQNFPTSNPAYIYLSVQPDPDKQDIWVVNEATVRYTFDSIGGSAIGGFPPTQDNCNGTYQLTNPLGNFGDPKCDFDKDILFAQLQQQDPTEAAYWFTVLIPKETKPPYNPNSYNPGSTSGRGAYGLYQMNPDNGTDTYDIGNVDWQRQTSNAINYNNVLARSGRAWCYWEAANARWTPKCGQP